MTPIDLNDPIAVLLAVIQALERAHLEAAVYGGLALAVYGEPRETKDADFAVAGVRAADAENALRTAGLDVILAFEKVQFGGQFVSRLTLYRGLGGSLTTADLIEPRSERYGRQVLARAIAGPLREQSVRVVSPEDFILLKILATRERDISDAASVLKLFRSELDLQFLENEIALLAAEIPDHNISERWRLVRDV